MSANSIQVQLELVTLLSLLQELFRESEPKKSLCFFMLLELCLPVRNAMRNQKRLSYKTYELQKCAFFLIPKLGPKGTVSCSYLCKTKFHFNFHNRVLKI